MPEAVLLEPCRLLVLLFLLSGNCLGEDFFVAICAPLASSTEALLPRDHVVALPRAGDIASISLVDENSTQPEFPLRCALRVTACASCTLQVDYTAPSSSFDDGDLRGISQCSTAGDACFDVRFVEERADSAFDAVYRSTSIWDRPSFSQVNTTADSLRILVDIWEVAENSSLSLFMQDFFPFRVRAVDNSETFRGAPSSSLLLPNQSSIGFFNSPRFPDAYPRSVHKTFTLINENSKGFIRLLFDDFHIHFQSELEIIDSDGTELVNTRKENRRPAALISTGNKLTIIFKAHDFTQIVGFRARYEFVDNRAWSEQPNSRNCDEFLEGYGGEMRLDASQHLLNTFVDCIWIIGRFPAISRTFDRLYLKVEEFHMKGISLRLEIREGPSSLADRVLLLFDQQSRDQLEHKQPRHGFTNSHPAPAFYVRLRGFLMSTNGFEIVYAQFYRWATALCPGPSEFHCDNARCIKHSLRCDAANHCGDNSDELCQRAEGDFSAVESDVSGLIALVVGVCGLVVLLISSTAILARFYRRRVLGQASTTTASSVVASGSSSFSTEVAPSIQTVGERRFYVVPESQVAVIEAPPSYDDALKHPQVPTNRSAYINHSFVAGVSQDAPVALEVTSARGDTQPPPLSSATSEDEELEVVETPRRSARDAESWV